MAELSGLGRARSHGLRAAQQTRPKFIPHVLLEFNDIIEAVGEMERT